MARTPKAASTPAAPPAPRGRKPKASAALPELAAATSGDEAEATIPDAAPAPDSAPKGRGGRKPKKQAAASDLLPLPEADEAPSGEAQPAVAADDAMGDTMAVDMAYPLSAAEDAAPAEAAEPQQAPEPAPAPAEAASAQPASAQPAPAPSAARWDRATDTVQFDWPAIEQTASQAGPNQAMAKLLVAARAEGASSRWPF